MYYNNFEDGISNTFYLDSRGNIVYCVKAWQLDQDITLQLDFIDI